jgi:hypothetical protein
MSEVKSNIANVEAALLQLSISANGSQDLAVGRPPEYGTPILDDQSDFLDLDWSDNESSTAGKTQPQSVYTQALQEVFTPTKSDNPGSEKSSGERESSTSISPSVGLEEKSPAPSPIPNGFLLASGMEAAYDQDSESDAACNEDTSHSQAFDTSQNLRQRTPNFALRETPKPSHLPKASPREYHDSGEEVQPQICVPSPNVTYGHDGTTSPSVPV